MFNPGVPVDTALFGNLHLPWSQPIELIPFFEDITSSEGIIKKDLCEVSSKTAATYDSASVPSLFGDSCTADCIPVADFHIKPEHSPSKPFIKSFPNIEITTRENSLLESTQLVSFKTKPKTHATPRSHSSASPRDRPLSERLSARISESIMNAALIITASARHSLGRGSKAKVGVDALTATDCIEQDDHTAANSMPDSQGDNSHTNMYNRTTTASHNAEAEALSLGLSPEHDDSDMFMMTTPRPITRVCSAISVTSSVSNKSNTSMYAFSPSRTLALSINGDSTTPPSRRRYVAADHHSGSQYNMTTDDVKKMLSELAQLSSSSKSVSSPCNSDKQGHSVKQRIADQPVVGLLG